MTGEIATTTGPRRGRTPLALALGIAALAWAGCGGPGRSAREAGTARPTTPSSGPVTTADYPLKGIVLSVSPDSGSVLIRHEKIAGFMDAMTMPFHPADESILGLLHPGDHVEGVLHVEKQDGAVRDYQLRDLKVTKSAPPRPLAVNVAKGKVQLAERPPLLLAGEAVPDFVMTGQDGRPLKLSELRGKVVVLTFVYTRCPMPDFCPRMDRQFLELAGRLDAFPKRAKDIRLLSVSFDPEHDTPEVLKKHAATRGAMPPLWTYAVASHEELARIAPRLGLFFGPDGKEIAHNLCTAIIDPEGRLARLEVGTKANRWDTADFLKTIYGLLPDGAK